MAQHSVPSSGGTNWRRFAVAVAAPIVAVAFIGVGVAQGAVPAQFTVSGNTFKIKAKKLEGTGFVQYGRTVKNAAGTQTVATAGIASATLTDLCQSVRVPGADVSLVIRAGRGDDPAVAQNLLIDMTELSGNATFSDITIGQDASTLNLAGDAARGAEGGFGQQAEKVVIDDLRQIAWSTSAGSFKLTGLSLGLKFGDNPEECF